MKITVLYTADAAETADIIYAFTKKIQDQKESKPKIFKKKTSSIAETQEQIIGSIPGVNFIRAQELLSTFSSVKNLFNAEEDDLKKISGIGIKIAKKIKEIADSDYNEK
jgi:ERCC4-type nuclease